jgi:hypothetical protein
MIMPYIPKSINNNLNPGKIEEASTVFLFLTFSIPQIKLTMMEEITFPLFM